MFFVLLLILVMVSGFAVGLSMKKNELRNSLIIFLIIIIISFLVAYFIPYSFFKLFINVPVTNVDQIINLIIDISRLFIFITIILISYIILFIFYLVKHFDRRIKKIEKAKGFSYLGGIIKASHYVILFSIIITPFSYLTKIISQADSKINEIGLSCENLNICEEVNFFSNDVLLNLHASSNLNNYFLNLLTKNKSQESLVEANNLIKSLGLLNESGLLEIIVNDQISVLSINSHTLDVFKLEESIQILLSSPYFADKIVESVNMFIDELVESEMKKEYPSIDSSRLHFTKESLRLNLGNLFYALNVSLENGLSQMMGKITAKDINNMMTNIGIENLMKLLNTVKSIDLIKNLNSYIEKDDNIKDWFISSFISPYLVTTIYFFERFTIFIDQKIKEFRLSPDYLFLEVLYHKIK